MNDKTQEEVIEEEGYFPLLKELSPYMLICVIVSVLISFFIVGNKSETYYMSPENFVVFDPIKFTAGQKAVASVFIGKDPRAQADAAMLFKKVSSGTQDTIQKVAAGRMVLVKQGVIGGNFTDITDDVMKELGLPTENIPTVDMLTQIMETEPTRLSASMIGLMKDLERRGIVGSSANPESVLP